MKATVLSFRRGRHTQKNNQFLLEVRSIDSRPKASSFLGRKIVWTSPVGKSIHGKITGLHGNKGVLRARFTKGLPGEALAKSVEIL